MFQLVKKVFDIRANADPQKAIAEISSNVSIAGYNIWLLFCSAAIASIGLDTNSTAVIIGAMLISPLMSPILGIGLSLGIHDKQLLVKSGKNLAVAVLLSLSASILYFLISPFANPTAEIEARTYPTALDIMVAFFGGMAGIISSSRSGHSIALPGVAIATALMPPLCTAGYGIATLQWNYFAGAFYLFSINAVFISLATFVVVKYLRFPEKVYRTPRQQTLSNIVFTILTVAITIPSVYFLFSIYKKEAIRKKIDSVVIQKIGTGGNEVIKWEIENLDSVRSINIFYTGQTLSDSLITTMQQQLDENGVKNHRLSIRRMNMTSEEVNELSKGAIRNMFQEMAIQKGQNDGTERNPKRVDNDQLQKELRLAFPNIDSVFVGWTTILDSNGMSDTLPMFIYSCEHETKDRQMQLNEYLRIRLHADTMILIRK